MERNKYTPDIVDQFSAYLNQDITMQRKGALHVHKRNMSIEMKITIGPELSNSKT